MKRIYLAIMMLATIALSSCSDFLDITPVGKVLPATVEDYRALLTDGYAQTNNGYALAGFRTDDYKFVGGDDEAIYVEHFFWNENNGDVNTALYSYKNLYKVIFTCNQVIAANGKMTQGTKDQEEQLVAEAYALRASTYLDLMNIYSDIYSKADAATKLAVPVVTEPEIDLEVALDKSNIETVFTQIQSDISSAKNLMKVNNQEEQALTYRFSKISLYALSSRVNLLMNNWGECIADANKVLEVKSDLQDLNSSDEDFLTYKSVENILAIHRIVTTYSQRNSFKVGVELGGMLSEDGCLRKAAMTFDDGKTVVKSNSEYKTTFRVPEVLLMLAEASLRLDTPDAATAKTQLKKLVEARYTTDAATKLKGSIDAMDNAQLLKEVLRQRRMELAFQGKRWTDLKRLGKPSIVHEYGTGDSKRVETLQENDSRYVIKFPTEAVRLNPNLLK